jgi:hypothetical protein
VKTQHLTGFRDSQDERFAFPRRRRQLHPATTDDVNSARRLALDKQDSTSRERIRKLNLVEIF